MFPLGSHFSKLLLRTVRLHCGEFCTFADSSLSFIGSYLQCRNDIEYFHPPCLVWACSGQVDTNMRLMGSLLEPEVTGLVKLSHGEAYLSQEKGLERGPSPSPSTNSSDSPSGRRSLMAAAGNIARKQTSEMLPLPDKLIKKISGETRFVLKLFN